MSRPQKRRLVGVGRVDLCNNLAAEDNDGTIAGELDLTELGGVQQDGGPRIRQVAQKGIDLGLGADVDSAGGVEAQPRLDPAGDPG